MSIDLSRFNHCRVLVVGDLMLDEYLWGDVERISPEAPVQIVTVVREDDTLGGSGNVVNNLTALGAQVWPAGVIGTGDDGRMVLEKFEQLKIDTRCIVQDAERPTTRKTRIIAANQHVLRIDREIRKEISPQSYAALVEAVESILEQVDIILVSDYGKGAVTRDLLGRLASSAAQLKKPILVDPKGTDFTKYNGATLITPNKKEAELATKMAIEDDETLYAAGHQILEEVAIEKLLITCGKYGMVLFERGSAPHKIEAESRQVYDVSGAGDTVLSVLGLALAAGASFKEAVSLANLAAGLVVSKVGTATVTQAEIAAALNAGKDGMATKVKTIAELEALCRDLKKKSRRIVFTNGCFDLLHAGHIHFFTASKAFGDVLIVALDDDESVRRVKGADRPLINADQRVRIIGALDVVDYVVVFATDQLAELIQTIEPDVLTKGSNYQSEEIVGADIVKARGGKVEIIAVSHGVSASRIIDNIKNTPSTS